MHRWLLLTNKPLLVSAGWLTLGDPGPGLDPPFSPTFYYDGYGSHHIYGQHIFVRFQADGNPVLAYYSQHSKGAGISVLLGVSSGGVGLSDLLAQSSWELLTELDVVSADAGAEETLWGGFEVNPESHEDAPQIWTVFTDKHGYSGGRPRVRVMQWSGVWRDMLLFANAWHIVLTLGPAGQPFVAFYNVGDTETPQVTVMEYTVEGWVLAGGRTLQHAGQSSRIMLAVDSGGHAHVAYDSEPAGVDVDRQSQPIGRFAVWRAGLNWSMLSSVGFVGSIGAYTTSRALTFDAKDQLYFVQSENTFTTRFWVFSNSSWKQIHPPANSKIQFEDMTFDNQGTLFFGCSSNIGGNDTRGMLLAYRNEQWFWLGPGRTWSAIDKPGGWDYDVDTVHESDWGYDVDKVREMSFDAMVQELSIRVDSVGNVAVAYLAQNSKTRTAGNLPFGVHFRFWGCTSTTTTTTMIRTTSTTTSATSTAHSPHAEKRSTTVAAHLGRNHRFSMLGARVLAAVCALCGCWTMFVHELRRRGGAPAVENDGSNQSDDGLNSDGSSDANSEGSEEDQEESEDAPLIAGQGS